MLFSYHLVRLKGDPIGDLIKEVLLEERVGETFVAFDPYTAAFFVQSYLASDEDHEKEWSLNRETFNPPENHSEIRTKNPYFWFQRLVREQIGHRGVEITCRF